MQEYLVKFWYNFDEVYTHKLWGILKDDELFILRDQNIGGISVLDVIKGYENITRTTFELYEQNPNNSNQESVSNKWY